MTAVQQTEIAAVERTTTVRVSGPTTYEVSVGGTVDHLNTVEHHHYFGKYHVRETPWFQPNVSVTLANVGDRVVRAPRLVANDSGDWFDIDSLLAEILGDASTDRDRALRLFAFFARADVQSHNNYMRCGPAVPDPALAPSANAFQDRANPVRAVTTYYASGCVLAAVNLAIAARRAGLETRVVMFSRPGAEFTGQHAAVEVFYDNEFHLFDPELRAYFLRWDNETVASAADICADPELVRRTHCLGPAGQETPRDFWFDTLYSSGTPLGALPYDTWTDPVELELRPGERFEMRWSHTRRFHYGDKEGYDVPQAPWRLSNSVLALRLDGTSRASVRQSTVAENVRVTGDGLALDDPGYPGVLMVRMAAPFPIVGGSVTLSGVDGPDGVDAEVALARRGQPWCPVERDTDNDEFVLDDVLDHLRGRALREFHIRITLPAGTVRALREVEVRAVVQLADTALPALRAGINTLAYRDNSPGGQVEITHVWRELDRPVPKPPRPVAATMIAERTGPVVLAWQPPDWDTAIRTYHVMIARDPAKPLAVSPNLDRLTWTDKTSWCVPAGWLDSRGRYVWRVRAASEENVWSPWSPWSPLVLR